MSSGQSRSSDGPFDLRGWLDALPLSTEKACEACGGDDEPIRRLPNDRSLCRDHAAEDHGYEDAEAKMLADLFLAVASACDVPMRVVGEAAATVRAEAEED